MLPSNYNLVYACMSALPFLVRNDSSVLHCLHLPSPENRYQWQYLERDDLQHSIYIIDLDGIRMTDFVGESVDFVKRAAGFSAQHYPERAGYVFVVNVPSWFKLIWNGKLLCENKTERNWSYV